MHPLRPTLKALLWLLLLNVPLGAQELIQSRASNEFGFWLGASAPVPATPYSEVLDGTIGGGLFYRVEWPWVFHTEAGFSFSHYQSRTTQAATIAPFYLALAYRLPFPWKVQTFLKAGAGSAYIQVRPNNLQGWDPLGYAGLEFSLQPTRRFRIGLRLDYNLVYEEHLKNPQDENLPLVLLLGGSLEQELRYREANRFKLENGHFFHFGLMMSFYF
ncbi:MAG: hypothetical protein HS115_16070 [Spirochaetales bacterium]|nr:hypothetical protein [Spirochaetales bacterium]